MTNMAIDLHIAFIAILFFIIARNIYLLISEPNFIKLAKKMKFARPMYHLMIANIIFTGVLVQFYFRDFTSPTVYLMIAATIYVMVMEIKRFKMQRVITSKDIASQESFKAYAKKKYAIDLVVIIAVYIISKIF